MWSHSRSDPPEGHKAAVLVAQHCWQSEVARRHIAGHRADSPYSLTLAKQGVHGETAWSAGTVWTLWTPQVSRAPGGPEGWSGPDGSTRLPPPRQTDC